MKRRVWLRLWSKNLHREDLNPIEEAAAFQQLIDDFEVTHAELGQGWEKR